MNTMEIMEKVALKFGKDNSKIIAISDGMGSGDVAARNSKKVVLTSGEELEVNESNISILLSILYLITSLTRFIL